MAEQQQEKCPDARSGNVGQTSDEMEVQENHKEIKRKHNDCPSSEIPPKSPRVTSPSIEDDVDLEVNTEDTAAKPKEDPALSPRSKSKSWRRSTRSRRSLPAFPGAIQNLCKSISLSLSEEERAEKLMEAAMNIAVEKLQKAMVTVPGADLEIFQKQVATLKEQWPRVAKEIREESSKIEQGKEENNKTKPSNPNPERTVTLCANAIKRLETESAMWDALLEKHKSKAEQLTKAMEEGKGLPVDPKLVAQSSQSALIASKPEYNAILSRQTKHLHTVELLLNTQRKMCKELLSFQESCERDIKEISAKLAERAGFDDIPCPLKDPHPALKGSAPSSTS
ncbi:kinetochore-associated protein DSN1 homolog [Engraulis encrasicolus]|uniref:kinetochore-associated protein DSN1 homolog n=1 Tax=Engraulis encrasicolus TaxID=184585 RepID=UPI002FD51D36